MLALSDVIRGYTDTIILAQLNKCDSYGYELNKAIKTISKGELELKEATLYTTFRRLESSGFISSYWGDEDSGARRRYYTISSEGKKLLQENLEDWNKAKEMINNLLS